jgi:dihydropteroate synthase
VGSDGVFPPGRVTLVGVLNVTPDSFSDGGALLDGSGAVSLDRVLTRARVLVESGAHVLDVGGESTRPGASEISVAEDIDTRQASVANSALRVGARLVNDVSGLSHDIAVAEVAAQYDAVLILGHSRGTPATMQDEPYYEDVLAEVATELEACIGLARKSGVPSHNLVVDPGIGFGKRLEDNLQLIANLGWLRGRLGLPIMVGASRKGFLGLVTGDPVGDRDIASHAACAVASYAGADAVRVHDAAGARRAAAVGRALMKARRKDLP